MNSDKLFRRIGEVSEDVGVPTHVLRYWESEFPQLKPKKGSGGQRLYRQRDVELVSEIKTLLYNRGYTIEGARKTIGGQRPDPGTGPSADAIDRAVAEIDAIAKLLA